MSCAAQAWHTIGGTRSHLPPWRRTVLAGSDEPLPTGILAVNQGNTTVHCISRGQRRKQPLEQQPQDPFSKLRSEFQDRLQLILRLATPRGVPVMTLMFSYINI